MLAVAVCALAIAVWFASLSRGGRDAGGVGGAPPPPPVTTVEAAVCPEGKPRSAGRGLPTILEPSLTGTALGRFRVAWGWQDRATGELCYVVEVESFGEVHRVFLPPDATRYTEAREYDAGARVNLRVFPVWPNRSGRPVTASITVRAPGGGADLRCLHDGPELLEPPTNIRATSDAVTWSRGPGEFDCHVVTAAEATTRRWEVLVLPASTVQLDRESTPGDGCSGTAVTYTVRSATVDGRRSPAVRVSAPPLSCSP